MPPVIPDKAGQNHGGHTISDWDYSADSSDCKDCHSGFELTGTIAGVHADQCNLCHVNEPGGDYTRKIGPGGDGSSLLGEGASRVGTCLTCHNPSGRRTPRPLSIMIRRMLLHAQTSACTAVIIRLMVMQVITVTPTTAWLLIQLCALTAIRQLLLLTETMFRLMQLPATRCMITVQAVTLTRAMI